MIKILISMLLFFSFFSFSDLKNNSNEGEKALNKNIFEHCGCEGEEDEEEENEEKEGFLET